MAKFNLLLLIHAHQPIGNFDSVFEQVYRKAYLPFVEQLEKHPGVRVGLHYSGCLLEWLEARHPEYFERLREMAGRRQVELVGGGFYEPILISIPPEDQREQLRRLSEYLARHFGAAPEGAWLTERVWEPQLPSVFAPAGLKYTFVDDVHFLAAGLEADQLHGVYIAEDSGQVLRVVPSLKALRYLLPFGTVEEAMRFLRQAAERHPGGMAAMGDDCEKFGAWPETYEHCYRDGWLDRFFSAVESASDWLTTTLPGEFIAGHAALGRADLPTASYPEMMEWVLPTDSRKKFHRLSQEFQYRPDVLQFLRGGQWRGFFAKYPESNLLHKKMLRASEQLRQLGRRRWGAKKQAELAKAREHILRAQCNDAYWHGVFGGLYAPHLRTAPWRDLIRAESLMAAASGDDGAIRAERTDFDADGNEEVVVRSERMWALIEPSKGGTIGALDFRPCSATLINSLQRRPEAYHDRVREAQQGTGPVASIHDRVRTLEDGLDRYLQYDRWARSAFRLLVFPRGKTFEDYAAVRLEESAALAGGAYWLRAADSGQVELSCESSESLGPGMVQRICCWKRFAFSHEGRGYAVRCGVELSAAGREPFPALAGLEFVVNFLAPEEADRYFETRDGRHPLRWSGTVCCEPSRSSLRIADEWQNVAVTIEAPGAAQFWVSPIQTVSESEMGFERVYQGSQILALWPVEILAGNPWSGEATLRVEPVRPAEPAVRAKRRKGRAAGL